MYWIIKMRHGNWGHFSANGRCQVAGGWWVKYSPEFRAQALERLKGCVNVSALARELGISRKWLYLWRDRKPVPADPRSKGGRERDRLRKRVADLEQLTGQQAAQIDFFKGARGGPGFGAGGVRGGPGFGGGGMHG